MKVKEIMTRDIDVVSPETTLRDAAERMNSLDVGVLPVCENDRLVGMITDRDITVRATADGLDPFATQVGEVMSKDELITCGEDEDVEAATRMMRDKRVRRLPVLGDDRRLVGILALGDVAVDDGDQKRIGGDLEGDLPPLLTSAHRSSSRTGCGRRLPGPGTEERRGIVCPKVIRLSTRCDRRARRARRLRAT